MKIPKWCQPCALDGRESAATVVIDGDPMCVHCAAVDGGAADEPEPVELAKAGIVAAPVTTEFAQVKERLDARPKKMVPAAKREECVNPECHQKLRYDNKSGVCSGHIGWLRKQRRAGIAVKPHAGGPPPVPSAKVVSAKVEMKFAEGVVPDYIPLDMIPDGRLPFGRMGYVGVLLEKLMEMPKDRGLPVPCRSAAHASKVYNALGRRLRERNIPIQGRRVDKDLYYWWAKSVALTPVALIGKSSERAA